MTSRLSACTRCLALTYFSRCRVFVYEKVYDEFVHEAVETVKKLRQGNPLGKEMVDTGAMVMPGQLDIIQELIDDAVQHGAKLLVGGSRNKSLGNGLYFQPTILTNVREDLVFSLSLSLLPTDSSFGEQVDMNMRIAKEEVFGPVMSIIKVKSDEELLSIVNNCAYGLGSSVFSEDRGRQERLSRGIRCGMTSLNDFGTYYMVQSLPFGGVKNSGFGRFAGDEGLRDLCLQKSVVKDIVPFIRTTIPGPLQYPVSGSGFQFLMGLVSMIYDSSLSNKVRGVKNIIGAAMAKPAAPAS